MKSVTRPTVTYLATGIIVHIYRIYRIVSSLPYAFVARWSNGQGAGLATQQSRVRPPALRFQVTTLGKLFTPMRVCRQPV